VPRRSTSIGYKRVRAAGVGYCRPSTELFLPPQPESDTAPKCHRSKLIQPVPPQALLILCPINKDQFENSRQRGGW